MNEPVVAADPAVIAGLDNYVNLPAAQQPTWPDQADLVRVHAELAKLPPLVFAGEVDILRILASGWRLRRDVLGCNRRSHQKPS